MSKVLSIRYDHISDWRAMSSFASYLMAAMGLILAIQSACAGDSAAPQLMSFDFAPRLVDVRTADQEIVFTAGISLESSGLALAQASFADPQNLSWANVSFTSQNLVSGNLSAGHYMSRLTLHRGSRAGLWRLMALVLIDRGGEQRLLQPEQVEARGFPTQFEVVGDQEQEDDLLQASSSSSASFSQTNFQLPGERTVNYSSRISSYTSLKNGATGAYLSQEYQYADALHQVRHIRMDNNGSQMETDAEFNGRSGWEYRKESDRQTEPPDAAAYQEAGDFIGSFHLLQRIDEYGSNLQSERSASGQGAVAVHLEMGEDMTSRQRGTGNYQAREVVQTQGRYLARDISAIQAPFNFSYTPSLSASTNLSWGEGLWSRGTDSAGHSGVDFGYHAGGKLATYIGQQFSGADRLQVNRVARGLYEMEMDASFSGRAALRTQVSGTENQNLDLDQTYGGEYNISQKVELAGTYRYDHPHLEVRKYGRVREDYYRGQEIDLAEYTITVVNLGNQPLGPVHVQDLFPPHTSFIDASLRPEELTAQGANWTLMYLPVGGYSTIELRLKVEEAGRNLVNRVYAAGSYDGGWVTAGNYSALEWGWLPCCPLDVGANKTARLDPRDPRVVVFRLAFQNRALVPVAVTAIDLLPRGMVLHSASLEPEEKGGTLRWTFPEVGAGQTVVIEYRATATANGSYTNSAMVETVAIDGSGYGLAQASATATVTGDGDSSDRGEWPPHDLRFSGL